MTVTRVLSRIRESLDTHARDCCEWVSGIALHPSDFDRLGIVEFWGLPVLAWDVVAVGRLRVLCDGHGVLTPEYETADEMLDHWKYGLQRPS